MRELRAFILFILGLLINFQVYAVLVKLTDLQTMAQKSDVVLHGYIGEQLVEFDPQGRIITRTRVEVIEGLLNTQAGQIVTIRQVGGKINNKVMPLIGGHNYLVGQELIFFGMAQNDSLVSFGAGQGKLDINYDNFEPEVIEDLGNISAFAPTNINFHEPAMPLSYFSVDVLKNEIRLMLKNR